MILVIDCYDSFVYNLVEYISFFDRVKVLSKERAKEAEKINFDGIVISPG
ncbi:MAG: aminodeoxychorismate/anthranilate synthase component II, partial [Archaeoglobaceae archaeon]|nr:aminodeoxychorismate/anthranilate synthase component II [Archaeoglobaceae archaeon]